MYYLESPSMDPYFNLALEEYLFNASEQDKEFLLLWRNENAVIVGKFQNTAEEINQEYVDRKGITVARRLSGGGAVYHDAGNLNYTLIVRQDDEEYDFRSFTEPVIRTLNNFGIQAEFNGRNDLLIDGRKFSGCSQYSRGRRLLHHGCIMISSDMSVLSEALKPRTAKIQSKGVPSVASRVTTVDQHAAEPIGVEKFKEALAREILSDRQVEPFSLSDRDLREIRELRNTKYALWEWNYGYCADYGLSNDKRFPWGTLSVKMDVQNGRIREIRFFGDFFGSEDIRGLEERMAGLKLDAGTTEELAGMDVSRYICGCSPEELAELLLY